jgi:hypothetical protein
VVRRPQRARSCSGGHVWPGVKSRRKEQSGCALLINHLFTHNSHCARAPFMTECVTHAAAANAKLYIVTP